MRRDEGTERADWLGAAMATGGLAAAGAALGGGLAPVGSAWWWSAAGAAIGAGAGVLGARWSRRRGEAGEGEEARAGASAGEAASRDAGWRALAGPLLGAWPHAAVVLDGGGRVVAASAAARRVWKGAIPGRHYEEVFTKAELLEAIASASRGQESACAIRLIDADGPQALRGLASPLAASGVGGPAGVLLTFADDSTDGARVQADYLANAGHELRTPLAAIRAAADTLGDGAWDDPTVRERLVRIILSHASRLESMIRGMLDLSRLENPAAPVRIAPVKGSDIAATLRDLFEPRAARRRVGLVVEFDPALERLRTDGPLLTLVLTNLVENAVKFAFEGSTVRIEGRAREGALPGSAVFRVIDRGQGIPLAEQPRVFERFYQVDPSRDGAAPARAGGVGGVGGGTGLGLSIVRRGVERLGGTVRVDSVWQQGTTMTVELPGVIGGAAEAGVAGNGPARAAS